ncbi:hypothetical protein CFIMG_008051RA00001 [Ceratocystis fimbriata CBS 114723]|uniref:Basic proline-rich protein n=1 Tax=Ceratocystis fimbriata CBS 114723 TaxID=1035309 RepID=A0A2C5X9F9_9PEZI|nr:hypothetical protein CFIMG_008051RA00001 [Ceratocystis fimbriata CBS 114723]
MEPVPETERLEDFKSAPRPSLRLQNPATPTRLPRSNFGSMTPLEIDQHQPLKRPFNIRRSTDPTSLSPKSPLSFGSCSTAANSDNSTSSISGTGMAYRPRITSPLTFSNKHPRVPVSHGRSKSHLGLSMFRTQSMPGVNGAGHLLYSPSSPSSSPQRTRIPKRNPDDIFPTSPVRTSVLESSPRFNRDRSISPVGHASVTPFPLMGSSLGGSAPVPIPVSSAPSANAAYSSSPLAPSPLAAAPQITMTRVRPASPLRNPPPAASSASASTLFSPVSLARNTNSSSQGSSASSVSFDSLYSTNHSNLSISSLASSSIPSTPTSARSRSPSVSSLETIPDSPDAEEAAVEADRIAQLKAAAEATAKGDGASSGIDLKPAKESRGGRGFRDKRKRWSVCGAERRGDLDLETIWED